MLSGRNRIACFLGWICTVQILHNTQQRQVRVYTSYDLDRDLSDLSDLSARRVQPLALVLTYDLHRRNAIFLTPTI